jgi:hypothetical protein
VSSFSIRIGRPKHHHHGARGLHVSMDDGPCPPFSADGRTAKTRTKAHATATRAHRLSTATSAPAQSPLGGFVDRGRTIERDGPYVRAGQVGRARPPRGRDADATEACTTTSATSAGPEMHGPVARRDGMPALITNSPSIRCAWLPSSIYCAVC